MLDEHRSKPLISIIITILNGELTLEKCLKSIAEQTFSDYELVIVDGGSKDRTLDIINSCKIVRKTVQVVPGIGLYAGLNAGVGLSIGKWLYFIGADDEIYCPETLQLVSEYIRTRDITTQILVGSVECIKQKMLLRPMFGSPYLMRHQVHHQGMFYDRVLFDNSFYNESMRIASDYEFNIELSIKGIKHQAMDIIVCNFGGDGISEKQITHGFAEMQQVHKRLLKGLGRNFSMNYFWLRRRTGAILRRFNLFKLSIRLKKMFG